MNAPCYKCTERHTECHSTCEKYAEFKAASDKKRAEINKEKFRNWDYVDYKIKAIDRVTKNKPKRK